MVDKGNELLQFGDIGAVYEILGKTIKQIVPTVQLSRNGISVH